VSTVALRAWHDATTTRRHDENLPDLFGGLSPVGGAALRAPLFLAFRSSVRLLTSCRRAVVSSGLREAQLVDTIAA